MTFFNTSVENRVEKSPPVNRKPAPAWGLLLFAQILCSGDPALRLFEKHEPASLKEDGTTHCQWLENLIPVSWRSELDLDEFFLFLDVVPLTVGMPARGNHLNQHLALGNFGNFH
jgi:hypothetical protein